MITSLHIRNLRGIRSLDVEGLGRVNLVIGRNESGKTTFLAAAGFQRSPEDWAFIAPYLDDPRGGSLDFETHWLPLFPGGDQDVPPQVWGTLPGGELSGWRMTVSLIRGRPSWPLTFVSDPGSGKRCVGKPDNEGNLHFEPTTLIDGLTAWWSPAFVEPEEMAFQYLLQLYKSGQIGEVVTPLREVNPRIETIEIAGEHLYVRLTGHPLPMRFGVLGDGARRLLEFALALAMKPKLLLIDELENGFHYTTLPVALRMLQKDPRAHERQIFATTHRDELIRVACEVFLAAKDDGLRIIRLDRTGTEHRAVVYTAEEALAGMDAGLEIRG